MAKLHHPTLGEIEVIRRIGARRITLSVRPSGIVRLTHPFLTSRSKALAFLESRIEWVMRTRERLAATTRTYTAEEVAQLRRQAKEILPKRVEHFAHKFGFEYGRVTIRAAHTRWGSCSATNNISLSLYLMALPEHLRDYIIVHELCHTVHHNHSAAFHALCDRCLNGQEQALRSELRHYRP